MLLKPNVYFVYGKAASTSSYFLSIKFPNKYLEKSSLGDDVKQENSEHKGLNTFPHTHANSSTPKQLPSEDAFP